MTQRITTHTLLNLALVLLVIKLCRFVYYRRVISVNADIDPTHVVSDVFFSFILYHVLSVLINIEVKYLFFLIDSFATFLLLTIYNQYLDRYNEKSLQNTLINNEKARTEIDLYHRMQQKSDISDGKYMLVNIQHKPKLVKIQYINQSYLALIVMAPYFILILE
jgi:hypothetical protein